ncbi:alpha/beta fold hydrolase [Neptuniibacter sp. QD48_55]|uniref:alpha/beta fold hydrolase n=1 Tax=Neptuniibacter sp. QD48_55 TaxID=3398212 RepID=UPI0039F56186
MNAQNIANASALEPLIIQTHSFQLQSYYRIKDSTKPLHVYIEGDGLAWISKHKLSENPTPIKPVALELASLDHRANILYLARPCQYVKNNLCGSQYWSNKRFSKEVIDSTNQAINVIKRHFSLSTVELVGFSGGAAVSILAAAERDDVREITTIAGNLDHKRLNRLHHVSQLTESLNPIDVATELNHIPQLHLVGNKDIVVPKSIADAFVSASHKPENIQIKNVNASHTQGWSKIWEAMLNN